MANPYSKNDRAEALMGRRLPQDQQEALALFFPDEFGYCCPVHHDAQKLKKEFADPTLFFSEYNGFLWCALCGLDYPTALCCGGNLELAIKVFLNTVEQATHRALELAQSKSQQAPSDPAELEALRRRLTEGN